MHVLVGITEERWPEGFRPGVHRQQLFDYYSADLQRLWNEILADHERVSRRFIDLIRWRLNSKAWAGDNAAAPTSIEREWSRDGHIWH